MTEETSLPRAYWYRHVGRRGNDGPTHEAAVAADDDDDDDNSRIPGFEQCTSAYTALIRGIETVTRRCDRLEDADLAIVPYQNVVVDGRESLDEVWSRIRPRLRLVDRIPHVTPYTYVLYRCSLTPIPSGIWVAAYESWVTNESWVSLSSEPPSAVHDTVPVRGGGCGRRILTIPYHVGATLSHPDAAAVTPTATTTGTTTESTWLARPTRLVFCGNTDETPYDDDAILDVPRVVARPMLTKRNAVVERLRRRHGCVVTSPRDTDPNVVYPTARFVAVLHGDTPTRCAFYHALAHGCVPVVTRHAFRAYDRWVRDLIGGGVSLRDVCIILDDDDDDAGGLARDMDRIDADPGPVLERIHALARHIDHVAVARDVVHQCIHRGPPPRIRIYAYPPVTALVSGMLPVEVSATERIVAATGTATHESSLTSWGPPIIVPPTDDPRTPYQTSQYALEPVLIEALSSPDRFDRVASIDDADLAMVPVYTFLSAWTTRPRFYDVGAVVATIRRALDAYPTWRTSRTRHVLAYADVLWPDDRVFWPHVLAELPANTRVVCLENGLAADAPRRHHVLAVPYPCEWHEPPPPTLLLVEKNKKLCAYMGRPRPWLASCRTIFQRFEWTDLVFDLPGWKSANTADYSRKFIDTYRSHTFALQPAGDMQTRRGLYQCLLTGCVPVIDRRGALAYDSMVPGLSRACVVVERLDPDTPPADIRELVILLRRVAADAEDLDRRRRLGRGLCARLCYGGGGGGGVAASCLTHVDAVNDLVSRVLES